MNKSVGAVIFFSFFVFMLAFFVIFTGTGGFDVSFMMIPFMFPIIIFVFVSIVISKSVKNNQVLERFTSCPNCGSKVLENAEYCHRCGESLKKTVICDYCGAENKVGDLQCHNCNALL